MQATPSPNGKCALVELAYSYAVSRLLTLPPSYDESDVKKSELILTDDPQVRAEAERLREQDRRRALWALRYVHALQGAEASLRHCRITENDTSRPLLERARLRRDFTQKPVPEKRWPLGFALDMCSRPESAHYIDEVLSRDLDRGSTTPPENSLAARIRLTSWDESRLKGPLTVGPDDLKKQE